jgi:hypothetical protein
LFAKGAYSDAVSKSASNNIDNIRPGKGITQLVWQRQVSSPIILTGILHMAPPNRRQL